MTDPPPTGSTAGKKKMSTPTLVLMFCGCSLGACLLFGGIGAAVVIPVVTQMRRQAREALVRVHLVALRISIADYETATGRSKSLADLHELERGRNAPLRPGAIGEMEREPPGWRYALSKDGGRLSIVATSDAGQEIRMDQESGKISTR